MPAEGNANAAGRDIGGMVYFGSPAINGSWAGECRAYIDPSLPVSGTPAADCPCRESGPVDYVEMDAHMRAAYLEWLSGTRSDPDISVNYVLLYFGGLEMRFFLDNPPEDEKRSIIEEVVRLKGIYGDGYIVDHYLGRFVDTAKNVMGEWEDIEPEFRDSMLRLPMKLAIGMRLKNGKRIGSDWALSWYMCVVLDEDFPDRIYYCLDEFRALFKIRYDEQFPEGLMVAETERSLDPGHICSFRSAEINIEIRDGGDPVPDVFMAFKSLKPLEPLVANVMRDLDGYSRYIGRNPEGQGNVQAYALLPAEIREQFPCSQLDTLAPWAAEMASSGEFSPLESVLDRLAGALPRTPGKKQMAVTAEGLEMLGYGLAPDPRFDFDVPNSKEPVAIFALDEPAEKPERVTEGYRRSVLELAIWSYVAHSDGHAMEARRRALEEKIAKESEGLEKCETRRLQANLKRFLAVPPSLHFLRRNLKDYPRSEFPALRAAMVAAAHAGGNIQPGQVAAIEKLYGAIGLDPSLAYSDLHAGGSEESLRLPEELRKPGGGEIIRSSGENAGTTLDVSRIAGIRSETDRVSSKLGEIFETEEPASGQRDSGRAEPQGLDGKLAALIADLIERGRWTEEEFGRLCEQRSLPAAGVMEAVNEWAFDVFGAALLDVSDGYEIAPEVADGARRMFEGARREPVAENESESGINHS